MAAAEASPMSAHHGDRTLSPVLLTLSVGLGSRLNSRSLLSLGLRGGLLLGSLLLSLLLLLSILLAKDGSEDAGTLARLRAALGLVLVLRSRGGLVLGRLLGLLCLLLGRLAELLELSLVPLAGGHGFLLGIGLSGLGLDGGQPAVALGGVGSLEGVLLAIDLEGEVVGALLGHIGDLRLQIVSLHSN